MASATNTTPGSMFQPNRRGLLGGLTALPAAPIPALAAPAADPDAELLTLAAELARATDAVVQACRARDQAPAALRRRSPKPR